MERVKLKLKKKTFERLFQKEIQKQKIEWFIFIAFP